MRKHWKVRFLPFFYRESPMGEAIWKSNHVCHCDIGNGKMWTYVWKGNDKGWVPAKYALDITQNNHSSLSFSGQLTSGDLIWNGVKWGLAIALFLAILAFAAFKTIYPSLEKYEKGVQKQHEQTLQHY
jgi:hypothetical protein